MKKFLIAIPFVALAIACGATPDIRDNTDPNPNVVITTVPTIAATTVRPAGKVAPTKTVVNIEGSTIVHVGEDVPAGTYRASENVTGLCYWKKSSDPEGADIIDNDIPPGGRPVVTLKKGQWFTTNDCPVWVKK